MDSVGNLRLTKKKQKTHDTAVDGEHCVRMAFQHRSLAVPDDIANIGTFAVMDRWTQTLFEKLNEPPIAGFRNITTEQIINADKRLWVKLSDEARSNLVAPAVGPKPFDVAFEQLVNHPEVLMHWTALPSYPSAQDRAQNDADRAGFEKGKDKAILAPLLVALFALHPDFDHHGAS